ncbi:MAG: hypothetical protein PVG63_04145, partial [Anaerolineales bacterium]
HREDIEAGGPMPPSKELREDWVYIFEQWVLAGMPETVESITPEMLATEEAQAEATLESTLEPIPENTPEAGS